MPEGVDAAAWETLRPNLETVADAAGWWAVIVGPVDAEVPPEDAAYVARAAELFAAADWAADPWHQVTGALKAETGRKGKPLFLPLRRALTGRDHGPEMPGLLSLVGKERTVARLSAAARS